MRLDALIFGGGAAGLWLLDELRRRGSDAALVESDCLGSGQTISAQGIIHGGLKYTLQGMITPSAEHVRDMPELWRASLNGSRSPDLRATRLRAAHCHLWRTRSLASRVGMLGARVGLSVTPRAVGADERPGVLARCPGVVARILEPVVAPESLIAALAGRHADRILKIDADRTAFERDPSGDVRAVRVAHGPSLRLTLRPRHVILTAGKGNADLRRQIGLRDGAMQRRSLHMVLGRGDLPVLNGHCVDGAATRITVTSDRDATGRMVWQVGGQLAESGTSMDERTLIVHAQAEIEASIPGVDLSSVEWSTYRVDRAEGVTPGGSRPETIQVRQEANVISAWPTKLALVPILAERIADAVEPRLAHRVQDGAIDGATDRPDAVADGRGALPAGWPRPEIARLPWESAESWIRTEKSSGAIRRAA